MSILVSGLQDTYSSALVSALQEREDVVLAAHQPILPETLTNHLNTRPLPDVVICCYRAVVPDIHSIQSRHSSLVVAKIHVDFDEVSMNLCKLNLEAFITGLKALVSCKKCPPTGANEECASQLNSPATVLTDPDASIASPYAGEPWGAICEWIDSTLHLYHCRHSPASGDIPGYAVSASSIDAMLSSNSECDPNGHCRHAEKRLRDASNRLAELQEEKRYQQSRIFKLRSRLSLSVTEFQTVLLVLAPELHPKYQVIYGALNNDLGRRGPSIALLAAILGDALDTRLALGRTGGLARWRLMGSGAFLPPADTLLTLDPGVISWLMGQRAALTDSNQMRDLLYPHSWTGATWELSAADKALAKKVGEVLLAEKSSGSLVVIQGHRVDALRSIVENAVMQTSQALLRVNPRATGVTDPIEREEAIQHLLRALLLEQDFAAIDLSSENIPDGPLEYLGPVLSKFRRVRTQCIVITNRLHALIPHLPDHITVIQDPLGKHDRSQDFLDAAQSAGYPLTPLEANTLVAVFPLNREQIVAAIRLAPHIRRSTHQSDQDALKEACRQVSSTELPRFARRLSSTYRLKDVVLPASQHQQLREIITHVQGSHKVMEEWGFSSRLPGGTGIAVLFSGPSGTGKTMAAQAIANELGTDTYQVDLARVVSKYIGETEKNLSAVFDDAESCGAVLLFDEADALFGKRSETRDAHDRYANIEVAYLLQRMEAFSGIAILTTNYRQNLDSAFSRRIRFMLDFPRPDAEARERIWRNSIPPQTPLNTTIHWRLLARSLDITGGTIRQICLRAAFLASQASKPELRIEHVLTAARAEFEKPGMSEALRALDLNETALRQPIHLAAA
ncbi:ATP-binding protein [Zoogloea sp.]|uniref:ATP-binding protein n=1 Tax=Zoogloea sp. TaxID=49181 RepID=UPI0035B1F72C